MKTALITGATGGIGQAVLRKYVTEGYNVILLARNKAKVAKLISSLKIEKSKVQFISVDFGNSKSVIKAISQVKSFDVAVNCAAIEGVMKDITNLSDQDINEVIQINLTSQIFLLREQIQILRKQKKSASILNVSSVAGLVGLAKSSLYVASKHAINGLTKSLALEQISYGIRINAICPGGVDTLMLKRVLKNIKAKDYAMAHPIGRLAKPEEVAEAIFWLNSKEAEFIVGACLPFDGGRTAGLFP